MLRVQRLSHTAVLPEVVGDGFSLASAHEYTIAANSRALVRTDLALALPPKSHAKIVVPPDAPWQYLVTIGADTISADYHGNITVLVFNRSPTPFFLLPGDMIALLVVEQTVVPEMEEVDNLE